MEDAEYLVMNQNRVFDMIKKAKEYSCTEALFAFGESSDKNEHVMNQLEEYGFDSMVDYVYYLSENILNKYEILPHTNMGIISKTDLERLSQVNASMGLMLETTNKKLLKTVVHKGRMEQLNDNPIIIYDGAHNEPAIKNLQDMVKMYYAKMKRVYTFDNPFWKSFSTRTFQPGRRPA